MAADGSIIIDTQLDTSGFKGGSDELLKAVRDVTASVDQLGDNMMNSFSQVIPLLSNIAASTGAIQAGMQAGAQATQQTTQAQQTATEAINATTEAIHRETEASEKQERVTASAVEKAQAKLDAAKAKIGEYYTELEAIQASTDEWLKQSQNGEQTENILAIEAQQIAALNEKYAPQLENIRKLEEEYERLAQKAREAAEAQGSAASPSAATVSNTAAVEQEAFTFARVAERAKDGAKAAGSWFLSLGEKIGTAGRHLASFTGKLARISFRAIARGVSSLTSRLKELTAHSQRTTISTQSLIRGLLSLKTMMIGRIKSAFISEITKGIQNALQALRTFSAEYNTAMNNLKNSAVGLSANISVSIGNFVTAIEPAITAIIDAASRAISYLNALFALLGGKSTVTVAKRQMKDYGAATEGAAGAAEKLNRQVYGFDQLNRRSSNSSGGGGGGASAEDLFEEMPIENLLPDKLQDLFDKLKNAFTEHRWYDLGYTLGEGLNEGLQKIDDWINNTLRPKGVEWARRIAETLNGLTDGINWTLLGKTVADGINAVFDIANTFLKTYDFKNLGTRVGEAINSLFANIEWDLIGETFANKWNAVFHFVEGVVTKLKWDKIGDSLARAFNSFSDKLDLDSLSKVISRTINGITTTLQNFVDKVDWKEQGRKLANFLSKTITDIDLGKITKAISTVLRSALDFVSSFLKTFNWHTLGARIREGLESIDWKGIMTSLWETIKAASGGIDGFLEGLMGTDKFMPGDLILDALEKKAKTWGGKIDEWYFGANGEGGANQSIPGASIIDSVYSKVKGWVDGIGATIDRWLPTGTAATTYKEEVDPVEAIEWRATQITKYQKAMADAAAATATEEDEAATKIKEAYERQHQAAVDSMRGQIDLWGEATDKHKVSIDEMIKNIDRQREANENYLKNYTLITQSEVQISDGLMAAISANTDESRILADKLAQALKDGNTELVQALSDAYASYDKSSDKLLRSIDNTRKGIIGSLTGMAAELRKLGEQSINGLIEGIDSRSGVAIQRISSLANSMTSAYAVRHEIKSPSRVFTRLGINDVQGLEVGYEKREPYMLQKARQMADSILNSMGGLLTPQIAAGTIVPPKVAVSDDAITVPTELGALSGDMAEYLSDNNYLLRQIIELIRRLNPKFDADSLATALTSAQRRTQRAFGGA